MSNVATAMLLQHSLKSLNLPNMARHIEQHLRQARDEGVDYAQFLLELTELELRITGEAPPQGGKVSVAETAGDLRLRGRTRSG
jgi:hypothetical protein